MARLHANGGGDVFKGIAGRRVVFDETIPQPGPSIRGSYERPMDSYPLRLKYLVPVRL